MEKIKIYSTPTCPHCIAAKAYFKENKIDFEDIDVSSNQKALQEMVKKSRQMAVPVILIGKKVITGFDREEIERILKNERKT